MREVPPLTVAVGVDVAEERKGLDLVALDHDHRIVASHGRLTVDQTAVLILEELRPAVVCVDSPSGWSISGRSRGAERELARVGITAYATGPDPGDHPFYRWMRVGFSVFSKVAASYPLYRGGAPAGTAAEVFPHASSVFLAGRSRQPDEDKVSFRRHVLRHLGVDAGALPTADRVDAALGALTGILALNGAWDQVGDPDEGVILLPARAACDLPHIASSTPMIQRPANPTIRSPGNGVCGCGCGAAVRRRFLPGHDAKLKSHLLAAWRGGDRAAADRLRDLGWLPS